MMTGTINTKELCWVVLWKELPPSTTSTGSAHGNKCNFGFYHFPSHRSDNVRLQEDSGCRQWPLQQLHHLHDPVAASVRCWFLWSQQQTWVRKQGPRTRPSKLSSFPLIAIFKGVIWSCIHFPKFRIKTMYAELFRCVHKFAKVICRS